MQGLPQLQPCFGAAPTRSAIKPDSIPSVFLSPTVSSPLCLFHSLSLCYCVPVSFLVSVYLFPSFSVSCPTWWFIGDRNQFFFLQLWGPLAQSKCRFSSWRSEVVCSCPLCFGFPHSLAPHHESTSGASLEGDQGLEVVVKKQQETVDWALKWQQVLVLPQICLPSR